MYPTVFRTLSFLTAVFFENLFLQKSLHIDMNNQKILKKRVSFISNTFPQFRQFANKKNKDNYSIDLSVRNEVNSA